MRLQGQLTALGRKFLLKDLDLSVPQVVGIVVEWLNSAVIVIDMVSVQNILALFGCILGKDTLRHFSPAWRSWQAVLTFSHISIKLKLKISTEQQNLGIFGSRFPYNCFPYVFALLSLSANQKNKYRDKINKIKTFSSSCLDCYFYINCKFNTRKRCLSIEVTLS